MFLQKIILVIKAGAQRCTAFKYIGTSETSQIHM